MAGTEIRSITARQVYTNRGNPGVEAVVTTENGATGRAMCTSGISIGTHEIHFDFDGGERFRGKGRSGRGAERQRDHRPALKGLDAANQRLIDRTMLDIVPDAKAKLGGNATAAVSAAVLKAGAAALGIPLYRHIGGANAMYLPVPGVAMVAGHERYGGGITTPGGKPTMSVMCFGFRHVCRRLLRLLGHPHPLGREDGQALRRRAEHPRFHRCAGGRVQVRRGDLGGHDRDDHRGGL